MKTKLIILIICFLGFCLIKSFGQNSAKFVNLNLSEQFSPQIDTLSFLSEYNQLQAAKNKKIGTILIAGVATSIITGNILLFVPFFVTDIGVIVYYQIKERKLEKKYF